MEPKDFIHGYLDVVLKNILDYDKLQLEIMYADGNQVKDCTLFKVSRNDITREEKDKIKEYLKRYVGDKDKFKIKILQERRTRLKSNFELIMLFSFDLKVNINDKILKHLLESMQRTNIEELIKKLRPG